MKVVSIVGARPQFIKCKPVSYQLRKSHDEVLVHTGQHYDFEMSKLFFDQLRIPRPDVNLGVGSGSHGVQTAQMLVKIEEVLVRERPDFVLVYGDTNSTVAGALAAVKLHVPVGHVEAGLRSFDRRMPEEVNRVLTDHMSRLLFAPTKTAVANLTKEGVTDGVHLTGDVMYDALLEQLKMAEESHIGKTLGLEKGDYFLATIHRPSNTDDSSALARIFDALSQLHCRVVFPVHPRTKKMIEQVGLDKKVADSVLLIPPVGYLDFLWLEKHARKVLTDSGGVQKEAYLLKVPCVTLRETTEWVETVADGWNVLVGNAVERIVDAALHFNPTTKQKGHFGDGNASRKIKDVLDTVDLAL